MTDLQRPHAGVVSRALAERIDELVVWLGLAPLVKRNNEYFPLNPMRGDRHPGSFVIHGRGHAKQGGWTDYVDPDRLKGDALDLVAYIKTGNPRDRKTGYLAGLQFLGWEGAKALDMPSQQAARLALQRDREMAEKAEAEAIAAKRAKARQQWFADEKISVGSPAWLYLASRGVDLHRFVADKRSPGALRFRPRDFHVESKQRLPTMSAAITKYTGAPGGEMVGVHRTFLKPDGSGKAEVDPQRKIWPGDWWGGAIRLARGRGELTPEKACAAGVCGDVLAIGEGIETMLSVALACPDWRVWAAGTLGAIGHVIAPPCVGAIVIVGENNDNAQADDAFARAVTRQAHQAKALGAALYVAKPKPGDSDFNDVLQRLKAQHANDLG